jgi:hypothetical protein
MARGKQCENCFLFKRCRKSITMQAPHISNGLKWALIVVAGLFVALLIFHAGVSLGERHALERSRPNGSSVFGPGMPHSFMPEGHGAVGTIQAVSLPTLTLTERDGESETVVLTASTTVEEGPQMVAPASLTAGENIVVIGMPGANDDQIRAELVRVIP